VGKVNREEDMFAPLGESDGSESIDEDKAPESYHRQKEEPKLSPKTDPVKKMINEDTH